MHLIYCTSKGALNKIISAYFDPKLLIRKKKKGLSATAGKGKIGPLVAGPHLPSWGIILIKG